MIGELSSYALSDFLMFTPEIYFRQVERYNAAVWPAHLAALAAVPWLARAATIPGERRGRAVAALLALAWALIGWAWFFRFHADINLAAPWYAWGFGLQALLLALVALLRRPVFRWGGDSAGWIGLGLFGFAVLVHPLLGPLTGRGWNRVELFGVAPDPTALGTLGLLLALCGRERWPLLVLPLLWCMASGLTALAMASYVGLVGPVLGLAAVATAAGGAAYRRIRQSA